MSVVKTYPDCIKQYERLLAFHGPQSPEVSDRMTSSMARHVEASRYNAIAGAYFHKTYGPHGPSAEAIALSQALECQDALDPLEILASLTNEKNPVRVAYAQYMATHIATEEYDAIY